MYAQASQAYNVVKDNDNYGDFIMYDDMQSKTTSQTSDGNDFGTFTEDFDINSTILEQMNMNTSTAFNQSVNPEQSKKDNLDINTESSPKSNYKPESVDTGNPKKSFSTASVNVDSILDQIDPAVTLGGVGAMGAAKYKSEPILEPKPIQKRQPVQKPIQKPQPKIKQVPQQQFMKNFKPQVWDIFLYHLFLKL